MTVRSIFICDQIRKSYYTLILNMLILSQFFFTLNIIKIMNNRKLSSQDSCRARISNQKVQLYHIISTKFIAHHNYSLTINCNWFNRKIINQWGGLTQKQSLINILYKLNLIRNKKQFLNKMAQKLGLALVALFGLVNGQIAIRQGVTIGLRSIHSPPAVTFAASSEDHNAVDSRGPILGHAVYLGEDNSQLGLGILNFANQSDQHQEVQLDQHNGPQQPAKLKPASLPAQRGPLPHPTESSLDSSDLPKLENASQQAQNQGENIGNQSWGKTENQQKVNNDGEAVSYHQGKQSSLQVQVNGAHSQNQVANGANWAKKGVNQPLASNQNHHVGDATLPKVNIVSIVSNVQGASSYRSDSNGQNQQKNNKVLIPVFQNLKYSDTDPHGQATKAPITIVTAPLVSTAEQQHHQVGRNQVVGKPNLPESAEQKKDAKSTNVSANKALLKNVDLLSTPIQGPIDNVHVKAASRHSNTEEVGIEVNDQSANINQHHLKQDLALGEARENAPFVVSSLVVLPQDTKSQKSRGHLSTQDHN